MSERDYYFYQVGLYDSMDGPAWELQDIRSEPYGGEYKRKVVPFVKTPLFIKSCTDTIFHLVGSVGTVDSAFVSTEDEILFSVPLRQRYNLENIDELTVHNIEVEIK